MDYNQDRPHKALKYLSPVKYAEQCYQRRKEVHKLYPLTASVPPLHREESRFVDKVIEKPNDQNPNPLLFN